MRSLAPAAGPLRVLAVGAHPDDIEIGCGATLLQLADRAATTLEALVLTGSAARAGEASRALPAFFPGARLHSHSFPDGRLPAHWDQVKDTLHELAGRVSPDLVLCPREDDAHQDHRLLGQPRPHRLARRPRPPLRDPQVGCRPPPAHALRPRHDRGGPPQGVTAQRALPQPARPGLVGRRAVPRADAAARCRVQEPVRRGVLLSQVGPRTWAERCPMSTPPDGAHFWAARCR